MGKETGSGCSLNSEGSDLIFIKGKKTPTAVLNISSFMKKIIMTLTGVTAELFWFSMLGQKIKKATFLFKMAHFANSLLFIYSPKMKKKTTVEIG